MLPLVVLGIPSMFVVTMGISNEPVGEWLFVDTEVWPLPIEGKGH